VWAVSHKFHIFPSMGIYPVCHSKMKFYTCNWNRAIIMGHGFSDDSDVMTSDVHDLDH
jgi:hypothetical protein